MESLITIDGKIEKEFKLAIIALILLAIWTIGREINMAYEEHQQRVLDNVRIAIAQNVDQDTDNIFLAVQEVLGEQGIMCRLDEEINTNVDGGYIEMLPGDQACVLFVSDQYDVNYGSVALINYDTLAEAGVDGRETAVLNIAIFSAEDGKLIYRVDNGWYGPDLDLRAYEMLRISTRLLDDGSFAVYIGAIKNLPDGNLLSAKDYSDVG